MEQAQEDAVVEPEAGGEEGAGPLAKLKRFAIPIVAGLVMILVAGGGYAYWSAKKHRAEVEQKRAAKLAEEAAKEAVEAAKARELAAELHKQHQAVLEAPTPLPPPAEEAPATKPVALDKPEKPEKPEKPKPEEVAAEKPAVDKKEVPTRAPMPSGKTPVAGAKKPVPGNTCTVGGGGNAADNLARCLQEYNKLDQR